MSNKGTQQIPQFLSNIEPNTHLLHLLVLRQLNNNRAGTASTKTRSEVRGGGAKPWKQKGTGRARAGSIRSPLWVGGGISFGPKPRDFSLKIPKKARIKGLLHSLAAKKGEMVFLEKLPEIKDSKTKALKNYLTSSQFTKLPILIVASSTEGNFKEVRRASNNMPDVIFKDEKYLGAFEVVKANMVILTKTAVSALEKRLVTSKGGKVA